MSLAIGDHLVIKRGDKVLGPEDEGHHEFEVVSDPYAIIKTVDKDGNQLNIDTPGEWYAGKVHGLDYYQVQTIDIRVVK